MRPTEWKKPTSGNSPAHATDTSQTDAAIAGIGRAACDLQTLRCLALSVRMDILNMIYRAGGGHTGGSLSSVDILLTLYLHVMRITPDNLHDPNRDRFIMSKGHSVEAYYGVLAAAGFIPRAELQTYGTLGTRLYGHPTVKVPGVELATGALGHGLSAGVGAAVVGKRDRRPTRVFVLMGDGEQAEGSLWEAAMAAANYRLDNLIGIIDYNKLQISGAVDEVMRSSSLPQKWSAFGWQVLETDGHDLPGLIAAFDRIPTAPGKPHLLIAHTTKGKGVSFMQHQAAWHHKVPAEEQLRQALEELQQELQRITT